MLSMALALATAAVLFELALAVRYRALLAAFRRRPLLGIAASVGLSWALGSVFGASGMIVMFAAIASTVVSGLVYVSGIIELAFTARDRVSTWRLRTAK